MTPPSPNPTPAGGEEELIKKLHKLFNLYGGKVLLIHEVYGNDDIKDAAFDELENAYVRRLAKLIAQQNQQAVEALTDGFQSLRERIDEVATLDKDFRVIRADDLIKSIDDIIAALTAAQPRKDERSAE